MTEEEFRSLIGQSKIQEKSIPIARDYLVNGMRIMDIAKKYDKTRQAVASILKFAIDKKKKIEKVPDDWKAITVVLPPELATKVKTLSFKCKERLGHGKPIPIARYEQRIAELEKLLIEEQNKILQTQEEIIAEKKKLLKMRMQKDNYEEEGDLLSVG